MAAGLLALGACGGGEGGDGGENAGTGNSATANVQLEAGEWEITQHTLDISAPGMPAGAAEFMKPGPVTVKTCITQEQAQKPGAELFSGESDPGCKKEGFKAAGGEIGGTLTCSAEGGGKTVMKMEGDFEAERFDVHMEVTANAEGTQMTTKMRSSGKRIGDCPGGAAPTDTAETPRGELAPQPIAGGNKGKGLKGG
jgi:hypothetical protein